MTHIERPAYLHWLQTWRDRQIIKVVSGVRRCGKSTLFEMYRTSLLSEGIEPNQIVAINFEDLAYESLCDYRSLYDYVVSKLQEGRANYVFLDEIQHVPEFEKAVDSLFVRENVDIYLTGSNAYFMSGELATLLSGRYVELKMLPLSFKEFCAASRYSSCEQLFNDYLARSSFPYVSKFNLDEGDAKRYLEDVYHSILLKDVVARLNIADVSALESVVKFIFHNIGSSVSMKKISDTFKSAGRNIDQKTVAKYLRGLTDSLILHEATRYNIKGRQILTTQPKYYVTDLALRNILVQGSSSDIGHILENVVYLELLRRGFQVNVGHLNNGEIDFVAMKPGEKQYFQVSATTLDEHTLERELAPFKAVRDNYPKTLLTLDTVFREADYGGVQKRNALDWLLE